MLKRLILALCIYCISLSLSGQGGHMPPPPPGSGNPAPLGFTEVLIGLGALYGARQVRQKKEDPGAS